MNGSTHTRISAATANIGHGGINVFIAGLGLLFQQSYSREDLTALAVTALRYLMVYPSLLDGMQFAFLSQALDADHLLTRC
jgi:hypothetical protein